jgi:class 3 adenylate cyclase/tetratricopeptide (TPR) repeat protein
MNSTLDCNACGAGIDASARFCSACGHRVDVEPREQRQAPAAYTPQHLAAEILAGRGRLEGERKLVSVLFCDLADSTTIAEAIGADAMHTLLRVFFDLMLTEIHRYEGTVSQFLGDGLLALFGAPLSHEDHARRAVMAGLAMQRALRDHRERLPAPASVQLRLRIGINTGHVVVGRIGDDLRMDYTAIGDTTNLASRLQTLAAPGTVLVSGATHRLVEPLFRWRALGIRQVKGRVEPVDVYRADAVLPAPRERHDGPTLRVGSDMVGRESELAVFTEAVARLRGGDGGAIGLIGEPGLGKTRLKAEVRRGAGDDVLWLEGRCVSFGRTLAFWPFLDLFRRWVGLTEEDGGEEATAALRAKLTAALGDEAEDILPYLAVLLALDVPSELQPRVQYLDSHAMGAQIFRAVWLLVDRLARQRPLALVFEDVHWADRSSTELMEHLVPLIEQVPLLIIGISRPDLDSSAAHVRSVLSTAYPERYREVVLRPLGADASRRLIANLLDNEELGSLRERILERAEGNPYFSEEIVRSLIGSGDLVMDPATARVRATRMVDQIAIPDTLQGVISARIDRLDDDVKEILKIASVIGRAFLYRVLDAIDEAGNSLERGLGILERVELVRERRRLPELEYWFNHALVQEVTYDSILLDRRRRLHREVAVSIEALFADRLEEFAGLLAHHYAAAEDWAKAQEYLLRAGDQAGRMAADAEAITRYRQALDAFARAFGDKWDPVERATLERKIGEALFRRGDHAAAEQHLRRSLALLDVHYPDTKAGVRRAVVRQLLVQLGHRLRRLDGPRATTPVDRRLEELSRIFSGLGWMHNFESQELLALDMLHLVNHGERGGGIPAFIKGLMGMGAIFSVVRLRRLGRRYHERALLRATEIGHPTALGDAHMGMTWSRAYAGDVAGAIEHAHRSAAAFRSAGEVRWWGGAAGLAVHYERFRGSPEEIMRISTEIERFGIEANDNHLRGWGAQGRGFGLRLLGRLDEAMASLQRAYDIYAAMPAPGSAAEAAADLALCELALGRPDAAVARLEAANQSLDAQGLRGLECTFPRCALPEAYVAQAELLSGQERKAALARARKALGRAAAYARIAPTAGAWVARTKGTLAWLDGDEHRARTWWTRSTQLADRMGAPYEATLTRLEIERRTERKGKAQA